MAVVAETFQEMLQRDFGYKLYKALLALPEKEEQPEAKNPDSEKVPKSEKEAENELKEEPQEKPGAEDAPDNNQKEVQVRLCNSPGLAVQSGGPLMFGQLHPLLTLSDVARFAFSSDCEG